MPALGADMEAGTLLRWLVKPGDAVKRGDIVAEVETDKADVEVEIFDTGTVVALLVGEGEKVPVGTPLATLGPAGAPAAADTVSPVPPPPVAAIHRAPPPAAAPPAPAPFRRGGRVTPTARLLAERLGLDIAGITGSGIDGAVTKADIERAAQAPRGPVTAEPARLRSSPAARRRAQDLGLALASLPGTGPGGAVTLADVERAAAAPQPPRKTEAPPPPVPRAPGPDRILARRRAIAAAMSRSNREIPHYYLGTRVDMTNALAWLERTNQDRPPQSRLLYAALLLKATALAVREVPEMNGYWADDAFQPSEAVHLGMAISLREGGLVAPAIHDANRLPLEDLMAALRDLVTRARAGSLRSSELADPTITVTNLGEQGVETVFPVIFAPQVAIVGFGKITREPWAVGDLVGLRPIIRASLAADHRASDGHRGGLYLNAIGRLLQEPEKL